jgi:hypothetical protein
MTLPNEWFISMRKTRKFLFDLLNPEETPRVPKEIRKMASECLKHFPMEHEIAELEEMYNTAHTDQNILISETNKEIQNATNGMFLTQHSLNRVASALEKLINTPKGN